MRSGTRNAAQIVPQSGGDGKRANAVTGSLKLSGCLFFRVNTLFAILKNAKTARFGNLAVFA
jgi:hypothetical protein